MLREWPSGTSGCPSHRNHSRYRFLDLEIFGWVFAGMGNTGRTYRGALVQRALCVVRRGAWASPLGRLLLATILAILAAVTYVAPIAAFFIGIISMDFETSMGSGEAQPCSVGAKTFIRVTSLFLLRPHPYFPDFALRSLQFGDGTAMGKEEEDAMPDPKECRRRALEYVWLSRAPASSQEREAYLNLAKIWLRLAKDLGVANDLENCQCVVEEPDDLQYKKAS